MTPFAFSIPEVCQSTNSGRSTVYKAINDGHLVAHKRGSRTIIFPKDLEQWLASLPKIEAKPSGRAMVLARTASKRGGKQQEDSDTSNDGTRERRGAI